MGAITHRCVFDHGGRVHTTADAHVRKDEVILCVPADPAYLAVLRTATAGLAARLDLTLDEIDDLRIAVDEASALLLANVGPGDELRAVFELDADVLAVQVCGPATSLPERHSFAWTVLETLVGQVQTASGPDGSSITLRHERERRPA